MVRRTLLIVSLILMLIAVVDWKRIAPVVVPLARQVVVSVVDWWIKKELDAQAPPPAPPAAAPPAADTTPRPERPPKKESPPDEATPDREPPPAPLPRIDLRELQRQLEKWRQESRESRANRQRQLQLELARIASELESYAHGKAPRPSVGKKRSQQRLEQDKRYVELLLEMLTGPDSTSP